ncbi:MAG: four helix bundle protein [Bacteroidetes bacterium]|nr:four helix bundle protein [Bacteroidota bacterium]
MRDFRKYDFYVDGMSFVNDIYTITKEFPSNENFGLTSQIRRAAVSIVNNIAEGSAKSSEKDFHRFLEISLGSAFEVETLIIISHQQKYINNDSKEDLLNKVYSLSKRLNGFIQKIRKSF